MYITLLGISKSDNNNYNDINGLEVHIKEVIE